MSGCDGLTERRRSSPPRGIGPPMGVRSSHPGVSHDRPRGTRSPKTDRRANSTRSCMLEAAPRMCSERYTPVAAGTGTVEEGDQILDQRPEHFGNNHPTLRAARSVDARRQASVHAASTRKGPALPEDIEAPLRDGDTRSTLNRAETGQGPGAVWPLPEGGCRPPR